MILVTRAGRQKRNALLNRQTTTLDKRKQHNYLKKRTYLHRKHPLTPTLHVNTAQSHSPYIP